MVNVQDPPGHSKRVHKDLLAIGGVYADLYADWAAGTKTI